MRLILYIFFILLICNSSLKAQTIPIERTVDWSHAGLTDTVPSYKNVLNIMNYGGVGDGMTPNNNAVQQAIAALNNKPGVIYFPKGDYFFDQPIQMRDSLVIRGAGKDSTRLLFDLNGAMLNMIDITGIENSNVAIVTEPIIKNDSTITVANTNNIHEGDWLQLNGNDIALTTSAWAAGTVGQIFKVKRIQGKNIISHQPFRRNYDMAYAGKLKSLSPIKGAGVECLYIERMDATADQTTNINIYNAVNCWVTGVESNKTNFAHIGITQSAHILIRGNYMHHSQGYGGNGQGYGTMVQYTSGDCLIENNIYEHVRHSMILQAGANGNVFAYNYSIDPYWSEPSLPANSAGDAVLHGNYAYANLYEGNIMQNIVVDNSHGMNGPYNTFFRNRAELYGIYHNNTQVTDSMNYVGNEVTNTTVLKGMYNITGIGHYEYGNNVKGKITPAGSNTLPTASLYLTNIPGYWNDKTAWPSIGMPTAYNTGNNIAAQRYATMMMTDCTSNPKYAVIKPTGIETVGQPAFNIYPNPAREYATIDYKVEHNSELTMSITDIMGRSIADIILESNKNNARWNCNDVPAGMYLYRIHDHSKTVKAGKIIVAK